MPANYDLSKYVTVQERILAFWAKYPNGRILTRLESDPHDWDTVRYQAAIFTDREDDNPAATGHAFEKAGLGYVNNTSHEENCETSAIGRALANLGFATSSEDRPSREEMQKVERMQTEQELNELKPEPKPKPVPRPAPKNVPAPVPMVPTNEEIRKHAGIFYVDGNTGEDLGEPPSVSRQHGIKNMELLNKYLNANGFKGGRKGEVIEELEQSYQILIKSGKGFNSYGEPDVFPSDIYDLAHHLINQD